MPSSGPFAAYVRVSKLGDRELEDLRSVEQQRHAISTYAERAGIEVEWLDATIGVSGAKADRQAVEDAVGRIEAGELAGLVVYNLSRLSRLAPRQRAELFDRIEGAGGRVLSATEPNDVATPEGRFVRELFLSLARMEWERHRDG